MRQQREESLGVSQGLGKVMLWHGNPSLLVMLACGSVSGSKALEPGHLLPGTGCSQDSRNEPVTDSIACNKPNTVGKMRCYTEDAAVSMPSPLLPPSLLFLSYISPQYFPLVSARNQTPPSPITASWTCELEELGLFICLPRELLKISIFLERGSQNDSWCRQLINHTTGWKFLATIPNDTWTLFIRFLEHFITCPSFSLFPWR